MDSTPLDMDALEARAKLQVKVHRTVLKHTFTMWGNALLVAFGCAVALLLVWFVALLLGGTGMGLMTGWAAAVMGVSSDQMLSLSAVLLGTFKIAAFLLLLCPGLGLRICGSAMKP